MAATAPAAATVPLREDNAPVATANTPLATAPFDSWSYDDARRALGTLTLGDGSTNLDEIARDYGLHHDFWRKGAEWIGPGDPSDPTVGTKIEKQFAPDDVIGEAISNIGNAFSEAKVSFAPLDPNARVDDLQPLIDEATAWISEWWDRVRAQEAILNRLHTSAWAGRAALRPWIPGRFLLRSGDSVRFARAASIPQALRYIYLAAPDPQNCGIYTDPATQDQCVIVLGSEEREIQGARTTVRWAELTYLDPNAPDPDQAATIFRVIQATESPDTPDYRVAVQLNGHLVTSEMRVPSLISEPVIRAQRQLNFLSSIPTRLGETAAFRERYIINATPQGTREAYVEGTTVPEGAFIERDKLGNAWLVRPVERTLGAPMTTELVGLPRYENGVMVGHELPQVQIFDPVDPSAYLSACDKIRGRILRMVRQGHLANTSTAETSGFAYEQARSAFEKDLNRRRVAEEGMIRDVVTGVIALAEVISGKVGYITGRLRVTVEQSIHAGARNPDSVRVDIEAFEKGLLSEESTMARLNVEDIKPERDAIRAAPAYILNLITKAADASTTFTVDGILRVLKEAGVPEAYLKALAPQDGDDEALRGQQQPPPPDQPPTGEPGAA